MDQFAIRNLQASAFVVDATIKTRALNSQVNAKTPAQINSLFDDIAYKKGKTIFYFIFSIKNIIIIIILYYFIYFYRRFYSPDVTTIFDKRCLPKRTQSLSD